VTPRGADVRARAARVIAAVLEGRTLERALEDALEGLDGRDRALAREICAGTLRHYPRLDAVLGALLQRPMRRRDLEVKALALTGLYQLSAMRIPQHAAVSATVDAVAPLKRQRARGLLNAVLRRYLREGEAMEKHLDEAARHAHPTWLWKALGRHWPAQRAAIATANNERPPMTLRVNARQGSRDAYLDLLRAAGIEARPGSAAATAVTLATPCDVAALPGFAEGLCSVQDESAQLAADCLAVRDDASVLDACAAPGGKACHVLELRPTLRLTAMDASAERLQRVHDNLDRLGLPAEVICGDAGAPPPGLAGRRFDAIFVDAPCSASGVLRRHPDIKVLRRAGDLQTFTEQQGRILRGLWPLLAPGGELLYITCSILPEENDEVIAAFLGDRDDARVLALELPDAVACRHGVQRLPAVDGGDGLYFARLRKLPQAA